MPEYKVTITRETEFKGTFDVEDMRTAVTMAQLEAKNNSVITNQTVEVEEPV